MSNALAPVEIFYSYAPEDEPLCQRLEAHLSALSRQGSISTWHRRQIVPGADWRRAIDTHLETARLILLLVSANFLNSPYSAGVEMEQALKRHQNGEAYVIPVLLRPVDWEGAPFEHLQCLPGNGQAVTEWENEDAALRNVATGIRWVIEHLRSPGTLYPLLPIPHWGPTFAKPPALLTSNHDLQNRLLLLKRVRKLWVKDMWKGLPYQEAFVPLGLHEQPAALNNPWRAVVQESERPARPLPDQTRITEVYNEAEGALLILGGPGAGKTTVLLELVDFLLKQAEADATCRLPVIFNLSSWSERRLPLTDWLIEELFIRYQIPRKVGSEWVRAGRLVLLLDGLDEVLLDHRKACIEAINAYHRVHNLVPVVVCSRIDEYQADDLPRLTLAKAVLLQPLTTRQIDQYLASVGDELASLRAAIDMDPHLQEIASTPLMLSVLSLTYRGSACEEITAPLSLDSKGPQIFTTYVQRMLKRRSGTPAYTPDQTIDWLACLAWQMRMRSQTVFSIEQIQPDWLPKGWSRRLYTLLATLVYGLSFGTLFGWYATGIFLFLHFLGERLIVWMISGVFATQLHNLFTGMISAQQNTGRKRATSPTKKIFWSWAHVPFGLVEGFIRGGIGGLAFSTVGALAYGLVKGNGLIAVGGGGLIGGFIGGLVCGLIGGVARGLGVMGGETERSWPLQWRRLWIRLRLSLFGLCASTCIFGLVYGLVIGLTSLSIGDPGLEWLTFAIIGSILSGMVSFRRFDCIVPTEVMAWSWTYVQEKWLIVLSGILLYGVFYGLCFSLFFGPRSGLFYGLDCGLCIGVFYGLFTGLSRDELDERECHKPNEGIWRSARYAMIGGGVGLVFSGLVSAQVYLLFGGIEGKPFGGPSFLDIVVSLAGGVVVGAMIGGGLDFIGHFILRGLLWCQRWFPWDLSAFLTYAEERILIRKVGGNYVFFHRLLLDYFADLKRETLSACLVCGPRKDDRQENFCPECGNRIEIEKTKTDMRPSKRFLLRANFDGSV